MVVTAAVVIQAVAIGLVPAGAQDGLQLTPRTGTPGIEVVALAPDLACPNPDDAYDEFLEGDQQPAAVEATLWWDEGQLAEVKDQAPDAAIVASFAVPAHADPGSHIVTLRCAASERWVAATFMVLPEEPEPPQLQLSPTTAPPHGEVTAEGSGFTCDSRNHVVDAVALGGPLTLRWDDGRVLGEVAVTHNGTFVTTFAVPADASPGEHRVTAQCDGTKETVHASLDVRIEQQPSPTLTTSPQSALPGADVTAQGAGFTCNASIVRLGPGRSGGPVTLAWHDGHLLREVATTVDGDFVADFVVPADAAPGDYTVTARCNNTDDTADARFVVEEADTGPTPHLSLSPPSGVPGTVVTAAGQGLACGSQPSDERGHIDVSWGDSTVATGMTGDAGFSLTFTVPADAAVGRHDVTATCTAGDTDHSISATFEVESPRLADIEIPAGEVDPGGAVAISGHGFPATCDNFAVHLANEVVPLHDQDVDPIDTGAEVVVVGRFDVPTSSPGGSHEVVLACRGRDGALLATAAGTITVSDPSPPLAAAWVGVLLVAAGLLTARHLRHSHRQRKWVRRHVRLEPRPGVPHVDLHRPDTEVSPAMRLEPRLDGGTLETQEVIR